MNKHKWYLILIAGLTLVSASLLAACKETGSKAPDFTLQSINGETISLHDFRGKSVVLTFWTTHCPACESQAPFVQSFYDSLSDDRIALLTINVGESGAVVQDFAAVHGLAFPILLDSRGGVAQDYGIPGVPVTFFIDVDGICRAYWPGPFQSREQIEDVINELYPSLTSAKWGGFFTLPQLSHGFFNPAPISG